MPPAARDLLGQDRALHDQHADGISRRPPRRSFPASADRWLVSSAANRAPVIGARITPLMTPAMPIIAQKPGSPGRYWPSRNPGAAAEDQQRREDSARGPRTQRDQPHDRLDDEQQQDGLDQRDCRRAAPGCCHSPRQARAASNRPPMPTTTAPIAGHHIQWIGKAVEAVLDPVEERTRARRPASPVTSPSAGGRSRPARCPPGSARRTGTAGPAPTSSGRQASATSTAVTTGTKLRGFHSNSSSSTASMIDGEAASRRCRSCRRSRRRPAGSCARRRSDRNSWANSEPIAPPVMMIGPSAPNGPPLPIETADDSGFSSATFSDSLLSP